MENNPDFQKIVTYMQSHWPSQVKSEWQVPLESYPKLYKKIVQDLTKDKSKTRHFIRLAGISGAGKTTQLLPAAEAYYAKHQLSPVLVAARLFAPYHPFYQEISDFYGAENVRKLTDEFSTIMMFMVLHALAQAGYDMILDVTLLDPIIEDILSRMLKDYEQLLLLIAASPAATEKHLQGRSWRHSKETEQEFIRATSHALDFYAHHAPTLRAIIWNVYEPDPVYDGPVQNSLAIFEKYSKVDNIPENDADLRRQAKIKLLSVL